MAREHGGSRGYRADTAAVCSGFRSATPTDHVEMYPLSSADPAAEGLKV